VAASRNVVADTADSRWLPIYYSDRPRWNAATAGAGLAVLKDANAICVRSAMDFQRLKYFIAVAQERHITRAAARLGMAQPPLTQQIHILEAELGTKLFERLPKGVALTPAGEALLEDARSILDAADRAGKRVRRIACG
jgi:hypothetical protein